MYSPIAEKHSWATAESSTPRSRPASRRTVSDDASQTCSTFRRRRFHSSTVPRRKPEWRRSPALSAGSGRRRPRRRRRRSRRRIPVPVHRRRAMPADSHRRRRRNERAGHTPGAPLGTWRCTSMAGRGATLALVTALPTRLFQRKNNQTNAIEQRTNRMMQQNRRTREKNAKD